MQIYGEFLGKDIFKNDKYIMELMNDQLFRVRNVSSDFLAAIFLSILEIQNRNSMDDFIKNSFIKLRNDSQLKNLIFLKILDVFYKTNDIQLFYQNLKQQPLKSSEIKFAFIKYIIDKYQMDLSRIYYIKDFKEILLKLSKQCSVKFQIIQWDRQYFEFDDVEKSRQKQLIFIYKSQNEIYYLVTNKLTPIKLNNQSMQNLKQEQNKDLQDKYYDIEDKCQNKQKNSLNSIQNPKKSCIICQEFNPKYNSIKCEHSYCSDCYVNRFRYYDRIRCNCSHSILEIQYFGAQQNSIMNSNKTDKVPYQPSQQDLLKQQFRIQEEQQKLDFKQEQLQSNQIQYQQLNHCQRCLKSYDNTHILFQQQCGHKICIMCWKDYYRDDKEIKFNCPKISPDCLNRFYAYDIKKFFDGEKQVIKNGVSPANGIKIDQQQFQSKNIVESEQIDNQTRLCHGCKAQQAIELIMDLKCKHQICLQCLEQQNFQKFNKMYCKMCYEHISLDAVKDFYQKFNSNSGITPHVEKIQENQYENCNLCVKNKFSEQVYKNTICGHIYCIDCISKYGLSQFCYLPFCKKKMDYQKLEEFHISLMAKQTQTQTQLKQEQLLCSQCKKENTVYYEKELDYFKCSTCKFLNCYKHLNDKNQCFCFCNKCFRKTIENQKQKNIKLCEKCMVYYCSECSKCLSISDHRSTLSFEQQFLMHICNEQKQEQYQNFRDEMIQSQEIQIKQSMVDKKQQNSQCPLKCTDICNCQNELCSQCLAGLKNPSLINKCQKHYNCFCCEISQISQQNCIFCKNQIIRQNIIEGMLQFYVQHVQDTNELPQRIQDTRINNYLEHKNVQTRGYSAAKASQSQNNQALTRSNHNYNFNNYNNYDYNYKNYNNLQSFKR